MNLFSITVSFFALFPNFLSVLTPSVRNRRPTAAPNFQTDLTGPLLLLLRRPQNYLVNWKRKWHIKSTILIPNPLHFPSPPILFNRNRQFLPDKLNFLGMSSICDSSVRHIIHLSACHRYEILYIIHPEIDCTYYFLVSSTTSSRWTDGHTIKQTVNLHFMHED